MEREPVRFFVRELEGLLDQARGVLAEFIAAPSDALAFVPNATTGINTVLRSLRLAPEDELLTTDHEYAATRNALDFVAGETGARVTVAKVPFPIRSADEVVEAVRRHFKRRTKLLLVSHVTAPTALVFPIEELVRTARERGIDVLVDGAHAPGMVPLDLSALGATYYTGNCHKWLCAPKGCAFLYVCREKRGRIRPLSISHGQNSERTDRSPFHLQFDWVGTMDPSAYLALPAALQALISAAGGDFSELMRHNRALALAARAVLCSRLDIEPPAPDEMLGCMASLPLPPAREVPDALQDALLFEDGIEVPVFAWPNAPHRLLRISTQLYNRIDEYERLAEVLKSRLQ
jgi:isopenicillin-N epimerase